MPRFRLLFPCFLAILIASGAMNLPAQTPDEDLAKAKLDLNKLATELRELEECQIILMVKDQSAERDRILDLVAVSYERKSEALANGIEGFIAVYAGIQGTTAPRGPKESLASFRYRVWRFTLGAAEGIYRKDLTVAKCNAAVSSL